MTATRRPSRPRSPWASDEHELFRETARAWIEREILPHDARWQARGYVDAELWPSAGEAGLLGTDVPAEHGGLGGDFGFECVIYEELLHAGFACFGKGVACWAASRWNGEDNRTAMAVGTLMNARGLMELIVINIGLQHGIIQPPLFSVLVLMAIVTTLMASPVFEWVYGRHPRAAAAGSERGAVTVP